MSRRMAAEPGPPASVSAAWTRWFPILYQFVRWADPLVRPWWRSVGLADTVELEVRGRRTGRPRRVLVGLLQVGGDMYVGHPNGPVQWTRNLEAAGGAELHRRGAASIRVTARRLDIGPERSAAIRATFVQHPLPGRLVYRMARRHIEAVGAFYRLEPLDAGDARACSEG